MEKIGPLEKYAHPNRRGSRPVLTDDQVMQCRKLRLDGHTIRELADFFKVTTPTIAHALYGEGAYAEKL